MARTTPADTSLRTQVYDSLREALTTGKFKPGQKITFRYVAGSLGMSMTPVREALRRLVAEGAFEMQPGRSVRVPLMTRAKVLELRDIRTAVEGLAAAKAAERASRKQIAGLRQVAQEIMQARSRGDRATDRTKIREFHFTLYAIAEQPNLQRVIEGLWLQTGPYLNLLYPDYVTSAGGPERRARIIRALQAHDAAEARKEIEDDVHRTLSYVAGLADEAGNIAPASTTAPKARRGRPSPSPAVGPAFI